MAVISSSSSRVRISQGWDGTGFAPEGSMNVLLLLGAIGGAFALGFALGRASAGMKHRPPRRPSGTVATLTPRPNRPKLRAIAGGRRSADG